VLSDENLQRYAKALYPVAFLLIFVPLADISLRSYPAQFGSLQWRFGTVGLLLGNFGTILLGLGLLGLVAALVGNRSTMRILGYVSLVAGVVTLAILALFVLDALQMRTLANANFKRVIALSAGGAMFAGVFGAVTLFAIGRGALSASRFGSSGRRARPAASPLVVAGETAGER
jgi:hypothetical protein